MPSAELPSVHMECTQSFTPLCSLQIITKQRVQNASLGLSAKPAGLPASVENLNGTWLKVRHCRDGKDVAELHQYVCYREWLQ